MEASRCGRHVSWRCPILMAAAFFCLPAAVGAEADDSLNQRAGSFAESMTWNIGATSACGVVNDLAWRFEDARIPVVLWAPPGLKARGCVPFDVEATVRSHLRSMSPLFGAYHEVSHGDFSEITWGDDATIAPLKGLMSERVPPIFFVASDPNAFPGMWAAVSGQQTLYEKRELPGQKAQWFPPDFEALSTSEPSSGLWRACDPAWSVFVVDKARGIDAFMELLAAEVGCAALRDGEGWRLVPLSQQEVAPRRVRRLARRVERDGHGYLWGDADEILVAMGPQALPELIEMYHVAQGGYFDDLTEILAQIPGPERDKAFLKRLEEAVADPEVTTVDTDIIDALADRGCQDAAPLIRAIAERGKALGKSASEERLALNRLGHPMPAGDSNDWIAFRPGLDENLPDYAALREALVALAEHGLLWDRGVCSVIGAQRLDVGGLRFSGAFPEDAGWWEARLSAPDADGISVIYSYYRTVSYGTSAGGFAGLLERQQDRWLPVRWRRVRDW
jgi:hypothetical protein